jgi:hypothetical protein
MPSSSTTLGPLPGFLESGRVKETFYRATGLGIHDLHGPFLPFLVANECRTFNLAVLLRAEIEISFGGVQTSPALHVSDYDQKVDLSVSDDGLVQYRRQAAIILGRHFAA